MTITEQLQFSVLTAPVATLDRRTLSQAWYSALYASGNANAAPAPPARTPMTNGGRLCATNARHAEMAGEHASVSKTRTHTASAQSGNGGTPADRRAPRSPLARKIERAFLRPRTLARNVSFAMDGDGGRVHVLLQSRGAQLRLVAICPPKAREHVAAALAQARYALALRGIKLDAEIGAGAGC